MKCPTYPKYKVSGVEWLMYVPEHWTIKRLKNIATCNDEALDEKTDADFEIQYVDISSVSLVKGIEKSEVMTFEKSPSRARRKTVHGDIIVSTVRTYLKAIAPVINPPENLIVSTGFAVVRPKLQLHSGYVGYLLQSDGFVGDVVSNSVGVSYPAINASDLIRIAAVEPPFEEQAQIARFLDYKTAQIDALIAKKEALLAKLAEKRTALISYAVTKGLDPSVPMKDSGVEWLGEIPEHWTQSIKLNFLAVSQKNSFVNGPFGSDLLTSELTDSGVPVVYSGDVKPGVFLGKSSKFVTEEKALDLNFCRVDPGDLLLAKVGDPPGDAAIYPIDAESGIVTQDVVRIKLDHRKVDTTFLMNLLNSSYGRFTVRQVSVESTRGRFSLGDFKLLRFILPPLPEQILIATMIVEKLKPVSTQESKVLKAIEKLKEYRSALITNAVTGKIDVRNVTIPAEAIHA